MIIIIPDEEVEQSLNEKGLCTKKVARKYLRLKE